MKMRKRVRIDLTNKQATALESLLENTLECGAKRKLLVETCRSVILQIRSQQQQQHMKPGTYQVELADMKKRGRQIHLEFNVLK